MSRGLTPPAAPGDFHVLRREILTLQTPAIERITGRAPCPVATYLTLQAGVAALDLESPDAAEIRRTFNGYYGVRRNAEWRGLFYRAFEDAKRSSLDGPALFAAVLSNLYGTTRRVEASFVSKLVAMLRPDAPVVDSVVCGFLRPYLPAPSLSSKLERALAAYGTQWELMARLLQTPEFSRWEDRFYAAFAEHCADLRLSPMKKLDFLIWAGAPRG